MTIDTSKTSWDFSPLLEPGEPPFDKERKQLEEINYAFINKWRDRSDYLEEPKILKEALDEYENIERLYGTSGDEGPFYWLNLELDENNSELKAKYNKIKDFSIKISNDIQFFTHRLAKVPVQKQEEFLAYEPLRPYKHFLETLFAESKYLLSESEEKVLNLVHSTSVGNWTRMVSGFLSKSEREALAEDGQKKSLSFSEITSLLNSKKKEVRDSASRAFNDILSEYVEVAEHELNSVLEFRKVDDNLRGTTRPDELRHISDDVNSEVVDALISAVSSRYDLARRFYELKARLLGFPKLEYHERNVEYGDVDITYSWPDTVGLVDKTFNSLDREFSEIFKDFVENGRIDVFPKKGKGGGAFCVHFLPTKPVYILLNHTGKLNDVLTVAHEMGHGINNVLMSKAQNALNVGTSLAIAEVASTFMEDFVLQNLLNEADDETRLVIQMQKLNDDVSTIVRQAAEYKFEQELHAEFRERGYLSKEEIGKLFQKHMADYMGDFVEQSEGAENWWVYWSHIRMIFYVYSYASGLLISKSMQNSVKDNPEFVKNVKEFLSAGLSKSPKDIFSDLGIDITDKEFWNKGLDEVEDLLKDTERLAKELGKIN
jgi:oligoendopeptidase F